jgi:hypothetical protein
MKKYGSVILWSIGLMVLVLDTKTAVTGALEGIELCIRTVIPSLFPFFVFSSLLINAVSRVEIRFLRPLEKFLRISEGSAGYFMVGILGGYPVGAKSVAEGWRAGRISKAEAQRLLGFCSNAGPSFIFGMAASLFDSPGACWGLWITQLLTAAVVGWMLPGSARGAVRFSKYKKLTVAQSVEGACRTMAVVCGWVVLFRVLIQLLDSWILWRLPQELGILVKCMLELSNGCCSLAHLESTPLRFILCATSLSMGGLCVGMQTSSAVNELGTGLYFPGKVLGALVSSMFAGVFAAILFPGQTKLYLFIPLLSATVIIFVNIFLKSKEKNSRNSAASVV